MGPRERKPASRLPPSAVLEAILEAPDRERIPGARPIVPIDAGDAGDTGDIGSTENTGGARDERAFRDAVEARMLGTTMLERRGAWHGEWAELDPERVSPHALGRLAELGRRWHDARPIVLAGAAADMLDGFAADIAGGEELRAELSEPGGLRRWLARCSEALSPGELAPSFIVLGKRATLYDPERDIDRVFVESFAASVGRGRKVADLWLKSSWLSTHADDSSLRLRFSFGREGDDDASRDILRHRLVAELTAILLPESALITANPSITQVVEGLCGEAVIFTQGIAYWNSPNGGALFHHDAFGEDRIDDGDTRQLGVCYLQLSGATAWLALSIGDLATRVRQFVAALERGERPWVRAQLFGQSGEPQKKSGNKIGDKSGTSPTSMPWSRLRALVDDDAKLALELGLPGCGALGPLVNRGPEFTCFLAEKGHAVILHPGDAILLPNRGVHATCMHSVFCASEDTGYSLSLAIRPDREGPERVVLDERASYGRVVPGERASYGRVVADERAS
jgi:hypothetical protein